MPSVPPASTAGFRHGVVNPGHVVGNTVPSRSPGRVVYRVVRLGLADLGRPLTACDTLVYEPRSRQGLKNVRKPAQGRHVPHAREPDCRLHCDAEMHRSSIAGDGLFAPAARSAQRIGVATRSESFVPLSANGLVLVGWGSNIRVVAAIHMCKRRAGSVEG